jgi:hypothetical protein
MNEELNFDLPKIKAELLVGIRECNKRGLIHSSNNKIDLKVKLQMY